MAIGEYARVWQAEGVAWPAGEALDAAGVASKQYQAVVDTLLVAVAGSTAPGAHPSWNGREMIKLRKFYAEVLRRWHNSEEKRGWGIERVPWDRISLAQGAVSNIHIAFSTGPALDYLEARKLDVRYQIALIADYSCSRDKRSPRRRANRLMAPLIHEYRGLESFLDGGSPWVGPYGDDD